MVGLERTSKITQLHPYAMGWLSPLHQAPGQLTHIQPDLEQLQDGDIFLGPTIKTIVLSLTVTHCHKEGTHSHRHSPNHASCCVTRCWMTASLTDGQTDTTVATTSTLLWFRTGKSHRGAWCSSSCIYFSPITHVAGIVPFTKDTHREEHRQSLHFYPSSQPPPPHT